MNHFCFVCRAPSEQVITKANAYAGRNCQRDEQKNYSVAGKNCRFLIGRNRWTVRAQPLVRNSAREVIDLCKTPGQALEIKPTKTTTGKFFSVR